MNFFPLPQGQIAVTLRDAQACFNLNALAQPTTASRPLAVQQLIALISRLDVPAYRAELIAESLWEFIDEDRSVQTRLGREEMFDGLVDAGGVRPLDHPLTAP